MDAKKRQAILTHLKASTPKENVPEKALALQTALVGKFDEYQEAITKLVSVLTDIPVEELTSDALPPVGSVVVTTMNETGHEYPLDVPLVVYSVDTDANNFMAYNPDPDIDGGHITWVDDSCRFATPAEIDTLSDEYLERMNVIVVGA